MTQFELREIVERKMADPSISGCIVSNFRGDLAMEQRHRDGKQLKIAWHDRGDFQRCVVHADEGPARPLALLDLQENATVRIETYGPCRVMISQEDGFLCLSR